MTPQEQNTDNAGNRAAQLTALLADMPKADDHDGVRDHLHGLIALGCAPLLVLPGTKQPADMRTPQRRNADDRAAREAAKTAGQSNWRKVKSDAGVHLATAVPTVLDGYLDHYGKSFGEAAEVNVALALGPSRLVVVDCDTVGQLAAFLADAGADPGTAPTVTTPGSVDPVTGEWLHSEGGHFWFVVPDGTQLPDSPGALTDPEGGYAVMWGSGRYVLIPPSVRREGAYVATGAAVYELPGWLCERITQHAQIRAERAQRSRDHAGGDDPVTVWGATISWTEILAGTEWMRTGKPNGCGCEIWTAPGAHASPKSATAHEPGCGQWDSPDPPLHVWTDHDIEPFDAVVAETGRPTVTRLRAVAAIHYDNEIGAAMTALGIDDDLSFGDADGFDLADGDGEHDDAGADTDTDTTGLNLPEEFWDAHPVLSHIRQFAHHGVNSADAVLGAVLARLSAHLDPCVRIDTGVKQPLPLNTFVGIVGSAGTGKSSAYHAADDLLDYQFGDPTNPDLIAGAGEIPPELPVGSGPGVPEAFMGTVIDPGDPAMKTKVRRQVRHKVLLHSDEGAGLVSGILDAKRGQDIGPTLRAAWTGAVLGQANASTERTREVRDYSIGLCVGFQLEALAALSTPEQLEYGTPQRFVYVSATDPAIPDDAPEHPGRVRVVMPTGPLRYDAELRARARREALARARGDNAGAGESDPMQAHRPALIARCAGLLVVLCDPGRTEIRAADRELAEMLLDTSAQLHESAMVWRREREAAERERQLQGRIREQVATAVALDGRADDMKRLGERILAYVDDAGGSIEWNGRAGLRLAKFNAGDRPLADSALARLTAEDGPLMHDGNTVSRRRLADHRPT